MRKEHGMGAYAILNIPKFDELLKKGNVVGDGLYSWSEYKILKEKYQQDLSTSIDLNNAELSLTAAELELQKDYISWFQNQLLLDYATGDIAKNIQEDTEGVGSINVTVIREYRAFEYAT